MNDSWEILFKEASTCTACELCHTRTNCVFGAGNREADVLFVGEAPGDNEDKTGTPFVGRAGQLLDKYLYAVDIPREDVYIANILKSQASKPALAQSSTALSTPTFLAIEAISVEIFISLPPCIFLHYSIRGG